MRLEEQSVHVGQLDFIVVEEEQLWWRKHRQDWGEDRQIVS